MDELRARKLIRSANNPVADYAEGLVAAKLDLTLAPGATPGYDAIGRDGTKYQIKARRLRPERPSRQLSAIRNLEKGSFDQLIVVLFDQTFNIEEMWQLPFDVVRDYATYRSHVNAHILNARGAVLADPRSRRLV
ncbi:MAG: hypothetical protein H0W06_09940 [Chloroflexia bacterium]|nr:hypothetical protein [Chloroflexia bacterium]